MRLTAIAATLLLVSAVALAQLAPNAPKDQPQPLREAQTAAFEKAIAPYLAKAKKTWPAAKARYLAGLPRGETFFVTTRLHDSTGRMEQVFVQVSKIDGNRISGRIASEMQLATGYRAGDQYSFNESELIDWTISKPDGSEEGNLVGKFLDTYRP